MQEEQGTGRKVQASDSHPESPDKKSMATEKAVPSDDEMKDKEEEDEEDDMKAMKGMMKRMMKDEHEMKSMMTKQWNLEELRRRSER